jgi:WD40 repeat protein
MAVPARAQWSNPFPGLRPFRESEEHLFFGRENQVDAMIDKLAKTRFLAVIGTSGSGKSSLVNCGLRPALHRGLMAGAGTSWRMAQFRPGSDPLRALARALAEDGVLFSDFESAGLKLEDMIEASLRMSKLGLSDVFEQAQPDRAVNLLVIADQFEELFRYRTLGAGQPEAARDRSQDAKAFVNLLLEGAAQPDFPIYVVLTMRSDFLGDCAEFSGLPEAMNQAQYLVPRLTREERRAAIAGPVGVGGGKISPVLLTRLVNDVGDNPDQLSILQHALNRTWARWQNEGRGEGLLDLPHYEAIGTMAHALDQHAEKAYSELETERQEQICERVFKALTDRGTDARGIRRPMELSALCAAAAATPAEVAQVIDVFRKPSRSFLMPPLPEVLEAGTVIDISHESLMRVWERLKAWAEEEAQSARLYRRLAETAALHAAGKAGLWGDPDLDVALEWRERENPTESWARLYGGGFEPAMSFLAQSEAQRQAEVQEREERQKRELERAQAVALAQAQARNLQRLRRAVVTIAVLFVLAGIVGVIAWKQRSAAQVAQARAVGLARDYADYQRMEAERDARKAKDAETVAKAQATEADTLRKNAEVAKVKAQGLEKKAEREASSAGLATQADLVRNSGESLETSALLAIESLRMDPENDRPLRTALALLPRVGTQFPLKLPISMVAFSPDGRGVVAAGGGQFRTFDLQSREQPGTIPLPGGLRSPLVSVNGRLLMAAGDGSTLRVLDAGTGSQTASINVPETTRGRGVLISAVALSTDGLYAAAANFPTISVFRVSDGKGIAEITLTGSIHALAIGPETQSGRFVAAAISNTLHLFAVTEQKEIRIFPFPGSVNSVVFSADGTRVAVADEDGTARVIAVATAVDVARLNHFGPVKTVAFSPSGDYVVSGSDDHTARVFDASSGREVARMNHPAPVTAVAFSRDGRSLLTASGTTAQLFTLAAENEASPLDRPGRIQAWALSPDGRYVAFSLGGGDSANLYEAKTKSYHELKHRGQVNDVTFSPDGHFLTTASQDHTARIFEVGTGQEVSSVSLPADVSTSAVSWDGRSLAASIGDHTIRVFDIYTKKEIRKLEYQSDAVTLAFSRDGRFLAAGDEYVMTVFRLDSNTRLPALRHGGRVNAAVFSPDGHYLATASDDGLARVFETSDWKLVSWVRHQLQVPMVAFSWDGRYVISGSKDDTVRVFRTTTGAEVARLEFHEGLSGVAFSSDDEQVIALTPKILGRQFFGANASSLIREACARVTRSLNAEEWKQYMGNEPYRTTCPK